MCISPLQACRNLVGKDSTGFHILLVWMYIISLDYVLKTTGYNWQISKVQFNITIPLVLLLQNLVTTRGSHFYKLCRTICNWDQDFWLTKVCLDRLIAFKKGPWLLDTLARKLINVLLNLIVQWVTWSPLWSVTWSLDLVKMMCWSLDFILIRVANGSTNPMIVTIPWTTVYH